MPGTERNAKECEIRWLGYLHPDINRAAWTPNEIERLQDIVAEYTNNKTDVDWTEIAEKLGVCFTSMIHTSIWT